MGLLYSAILPIALTNANDGRTTHFGASSQRRKKYLRLLATLGYKRQPFPFQVDVVVTRILGPNQRMMDSSSLLRGNWKEIEDSLVQLGWFHDDCTKHIRLTLATQDSSRKHLGPATEIKIYNCGAIKIDCENES